MRLVARRQSLDRMLLQSGRIALAVAGLLENDLRQSRAGGFGLERAVAMWPVSLRACHAPSNAIDIACVASGSKASLRAYGRIDPTAHPLPQG
jgi:hypothetical protein